MNKLIITLIITANVAFAGFGSFGFTSTRYTSQGGAGVANPDRIYSVGLNPAGTMMLNDSSYLQFNLIIPNAGVGFNNSAFSGSDLETYFNAENGASKILTEEDEDELLRLIEEDADLFIQTRVNLFRAGWMISPTIGAFTISVDDNISLRTTLPYQMVELAFRGNELDREYIFDNFEYQAGYLRSYSLNYARPIISESESFFQNLNVGVGLKFVQGFGYSDFVTNGASLYTDPNSKININIDGDGRSAAGQEIYDLANDNIETQDVLNPFLESGGSGLGFDIGAVAELKGGIQVGLSLTDIGNISFNKNVEITNQSLVNIVEEITDKEIDSLESGPVRTMSNESEFDVSLPTALRLGVTIPVQKYIPIPGTLTASIDYFQGFNENFANSTTGRISVGAEWLPFEAWPSIMIGTGNDRFGNIRTALGLGYSISVFDVYVGTRDFVSTISGGNRASFSFNVRWKIW